MLTKYQLLNNISRLQDELKNLKTKEENVSKQILEEEKELKNFDKKINFLLKDFNYDDIEIKKVIYNDYKEPFKIHFNYKNERYFIKEAYDDLYAHDITVYKVFENKHHSIIKVEMLITSNLNTPLKKFVQDKVYSHYDKKCFIETFINIFGIDFLDNLWEK